MRRGYTIGTALHRAQGDLLRQSGRSWGYDSWVVAGAARHPGDLRLTISGPHAKTTEAPAFSERDRYGDVIAFSAPAAVTGAKQLTAVAARATARRFLGRQAPHIARVGLSLVSEQPTSHQSGELLESLTYRSLVDGVPGATIAQLEVDLRSGNVVYEAAGQTTPTSSRFIVSRARAQATASGSVGGGRIISATKDIWRYPRWTVMLHPSTRPALTVAVQIDAATGHVMSVNDANPSLGCRHRGR